jgi:hypothetical protein
MSRLFDGLRIARSNHFHPLHGWMKIILSRLTDEPDVTLVGTFEVSEDDAQPFIAIGFSMP